ncbi:MAG TPA: hypothetical protein VFX79_00255 [Candidatus Saccharimonadales bacterium]|nr:hypothetical protein [Candidatus Saccharimonadales bacterium]
MTNRLNGSVESAPNFPSIVLDSDRPGAPDGSGALIAAKRGALDGVIGNVMRKHGATPVSYEGFEGEVDIKDATGSDVSIIGAQRSEPPMTASEATEIGTEIYERWHKISGRTLPDFCDTVHYVPLEIIKRPELVI